MINQNRTADIIGVQIDFGASRRGVNMGPSAIRFAGLADSLELLGISCRDKGDIIPGGKKCNHDPRLKNFHQVFDANRRLYAEVSASLSDGRFPIILGGDHSIAAGSISATANHYGKVGVIWIDAHGDFNDAESSGSGNMHGMPFSAVCGHGPDDMISFWEKKNFINCSTSVLIGARDLDNKEKKRLLDAKVHVFSISDVDRLGMAEVMNRAIEIAGKDTEGIHVSYDIDAITPQEAPGVGTPVHSGLTVREAFLAAEILAERAMLLAIDMVEVNPMLDVMNKTGSLAAELILSMLGKTVF